MTEFQSVPLGMLSESPSNPRHRGKDDLADLTQSIRSLGILEPLLVRECDDGLLIVSGHRRFRAASIAGLKEVPVRVLDITEQDALEVAIVENLQRRDVHPLDEADGFATLRDRMSAEVIADRVGKSLPYVYQRLQLLKLTTKARKAFEKEQLSLGHALVIARLQPKDQDEVLSWSWATSRGARELAEAIQSRIFLDLSKVSWPTDDAELVPKAGACGTCPKRAGTTPALFEDVAKGDTCTDPACFKAKSAAFLKRRSAELGDIPRISVERDWDPKSRSAKAKAGILIESECFKATKVTCPKSVKALIVDGPDAGATMKVCPVKTCRIHNPKPERPPAAPQRRADPEWEIRREVGVQLEAEVLAKVAKVKKLAGGDLFAIATALTGARPADGAWTEAGAVVSLVKEAIATDPDALEDFAVRYKVDGDAIEKRVRAGKEAAA